MQQFAHFIKNELQSELDFKDLRDKCQVYVEILANRFLCVTCYYNGKFKLG